MRGGGTRGGTKSSMFDTRPSSCCAAGRAPNYFGSIDGLKSHWPFVFAPSSCRISIICTHWSETPPSMYACAHTHTAHCCAPRRLIETEVRVKGCKVILQRRGASPPSGSADGLAPPRLHAGAAGVCVCVMWGRSAVSPGHRWRPAVTWQN